MSIGEVNAPQTRKVLTTTSEASGGASSNVIHFDVNVDLGKSTIIMFAVLVLVLAVACYVIGVDIAERDGQKVTVERLAQDQSERDARYHDELMRQAQATHDAYQKAETEARMTEYYIIETDAKLVAAGVKRPREIFQEFKKHYAQEHKQ